MIRVVLRKELRDNWRDRRSVLGALVLPAIGPLLLLLVFGLISERRAERSLEVPVVGAQHAPQLISFLAGAGAEILEPPADPERAVIDGDVELVLRIDESYQTALAAVRAAPVELLIDASNAKAHGSIRRLNGLLAAYADQLTGQRLVLRGVAPEVAHPLAVRERDLATPKRAAAQVLGIIPMLLVLIAFIGGMNIAIDTTAGERERGSLEPLLLNPATLGSIVIGKWLATAVFALAVLSLGLTGFVAIVTLAPPEGLGTAVTFGVTEALWALSALAPLAILAAALQMVVATFARTFKEAQTYLSLFSLLPIAPALFLMFDAATSQLWMMFVPAMGQIATVNDILRGEVVPWHHIAILWATSAVYSAGCVTVLTRLLRRETIVFGR